MVPVSPMMDPDDKWVWIDQAAKSSPSISLPDQKLTPITDWPDLPSDDSVRESAKPRPVDHRAARKPIPPSVVRATMLHLEGEPEQAIRELEIGLQDGEPPVELYTALGALQMELQRFEAAASSYRQVLDREPDNDGCKHNL